MIFSKTFSRWLLIWPLLLVVSLVLVSCGDDDSAPTTTTTEGQVGGSPEAANELPEQVEKATLTISDGTFEEGELRLLQEVPTRLSIVNQDDEAYQFRVEGFLLAQEVPADTTTEISFTTPSIDDYTGELLNADGEDVVSDIRVVIQAPSGDAP